MATKVRKQIYIERDQEVLLKRLTQETGASEAEIVRQALDLHTRYSHYWQHELRVWEQERAFIAQWMAQGPVTGRRKWQREELHER